MQKLKYVKFRNHQSIHSVSNLTFNKICQRALNLNIHCQRYHVTVTCEMKIFADHTSFCIPRHTTWAIFLLADDFDFVVVNVDNVVHIYQLSFSVFIRKFGTI